MASERFDCVVVGGGLAGLAMALALGQALGPAARIGLVDRAPLGGASAADEAAADVRASAIAAGSRRVLTALGVWDAVAAAAQAVTAIDITDSSLAAGVRPVVLSYANTVGAGETAATHIVPNGVLLAALARGVERQANVVAMGGRQVVAWRADAYGGTVTLDDGRTLTASLVIGADGRRSALRALAGIKTVGWTYPQLGIVTTVGLELAHEGRAVQHFLPGGPFAILPLVGRRACITWTEHESEARRILALDAEGFLGELEQRFGGRLGRITCDGVRQSWPLDMHLARSRIGRRLALIGDAACGVHPIAGQGLNLGLRDVAALAEVVADAARLGLEIGSALVHERYERWRRADAAVSAAAFDALNRLFASDWSVARTARDFGLGLVDRTPALKQWLVAEAAGMTGFVPRLMRGEAV